MNVTVKELEAAVAKLEIDKSELIRTSTKATETAEEKVAQAKEARAELLQKSKALTKA